MVLYVVLAGCGDDVFDPTVTCGNGVVDRGEICLERVGSGRLDFDFDLNLIPSCTIQLHDVDGDGIDELVTTAPYFRVWKFDANAAEGFFEPWSTRQDHAFGCPAHDEARDLWFAPAGDVITAFRLGSDGTLTVVDSRVIAPSGLGESTGFIELRLADVDGDGEGEIVGHSSDFNLVVIEVEQDGHLGAEARYEAESLSDLMEVGDFDGDGRDDVALYSTIHFGRSMDSPVALPSQPIGRAAVDVDGDGIDDLLGSKYTDDGAMLGYWLGDPDEPLLEARLFPSAAEVRSVHPVDLDLDHPPEFIGYGLEGVYIYQFDDELAPRRALPFDAPHGNPASSVHFGHLNDDEVPDVVVPVYDDVHPEAWRPYGLWLSNP